MILSNLNLQVTSSLSPVLLEPLVEARVPVESADRLLPAVDVPGQAPALGGQLLDPAFQKAVVLEVIKENCQVSGKA